VAGGVHDDVYAVNPRYGTKYVFVFAMFEERGREDYTVRGGSRKSQVQMKVQVHIFMQYLFNRSTSDSAKRVVKPGYLQR